MSVTFRIPELSSAFWAQDEVKRALQSHRQHESSVLKSARESLSVAASARDAMRGLDRLSDTREIARLSSMSHVVEEQALDHAVDILGERNRIVEDVLAVRSAFDVCGGSALTEMTLPNSALEAGAAAGIMSDVFSIPSIDSTLQQIMDVQGECHRLIDNGVSIRETIEAITHLQNHLEPWQTDLRSTQEFISGVAMALPNFASIASGLSAVNGYANLTELSSQLRHGMAIPASANRVVQSHIEQLEDLTRSLASSFGIVNSPSDLAALLASSRISDPRIGWVGKFENLVESFDEEEQESTTAAAPTSHPIETPSPEIGDDHRALATQMTVMFIPIRLKLRSLSRRIAVAAHQQGLQDEEMIVLIAAEHPEVGPILLQQWTKYQTFMGMYRAPRGRLKSGADEEMGLDDWAAFRLAVDDLEAILDDIIPRDSRS